MFRTSVAGLVLLAAALAVASPPCPKGHGYWDTNRQECAQCKVCSHNEVVLIPCQPYKDTMCGPMSALNIKWPWRQPPAAGNGRPSSSTTTPTPTPTTTTSTTTAAPPPSPTRLYIFSTRKMRPLSRKVTTVLTTAASTASPSTVVATEETTEAATTTVASSPPPPAPSSTEAASTTEAASSTTEAPTTKVSAQPFLQTETTLEWDWQALALAVTIAAFVVLLVVFAVYAAVHARRATHRRRRIQKELDAAHLSLFPVTSGHDAEMQTLGSPSSPKGMFKANQCLYLEKLLEQKQTRRANIYVETGRQATPAPARRSSRWKEKPTAARTPC